jgi:hypothetical protein
MISWYYITTTDANALCTRLRVQGADANDFAEFKV